jgi:DNA-binding transcriptional ArsR family regulator
MDQLSQAFAALADPTRRDLVARLAVGEATVGELAAPYEMSVQAVSKHVAVLERAGLVSKTKQAQRRPVRLEGQVLELMTKWIERYQRQAEERYQALDDVLADLDTDGNPLPKDRRPTRTTREEAS